MNRLGTLIVSGAVVLALFLLGAPGRAAASHVACGDRITANTRLDSDLVDCSGAGIVIGADNITLDLAGHTIDGAQFVAEEGVRNDGFDGVTIKDGTVIEASPAPEVRDGGGNRAAGNGNPAQCLNVTCR